MILEILVAGLAVLVLLIVVRQNKIIKDLDNLTDLVIHLSMEEAKKKLKEIADKLSMDVKKKK